MHPEISVILPVYNGMPHLKHSIQSVLNQTLQSFELLIADDGSRDGSIEFLQQLKDPRVVLIINASNLGLFPNLNQLIKGTKSNLIKLWAQDDIMYPSCLEETIKFHNQFPGLGFSYSDRDIIDESGNLVRLAKQDNTPSYIPSHLHDEISLGYGSITGNISNVTLNKEALDKVGVFNERMQFSGDFELWVRLTAHYPVGRIPLTLIQLRDHPKQLSRLNNNIINQFKEDMLIFRILLSRVGESTRYYGEKMIRWRHMPYYFSVTLFLMRNKEWEIFRQYLHEVNKHIPIHYFIFFGIVAKMAQKTGLEKYLLPRK